MKKLLCMLLCMLMLPAFAAADCEAHGYAPYSCACGSGSFPEQLVCLSCDALNAGSQACPECGGTGRKDCSCEGGQTLTGAVKCEKCNGLGGDFIKGTDCPYCELGWKWTYEDLPQMHRRLQDLPDPAGAHVALQRLRCRHAPLPPVL